MTREEAAALLVSLYADYQNLVGNKDDYAWAVAIAVSALGIEKENENNG